MTVIPEDFDFGYDPTQQEPIGLTSLPPAALPSSFTVNETYLPPPGSQGACPSCVAWGTVYGMLSFTAAAKGAYSPNDPSLQASPAFIYIKVMQEIGQADDACTGSKFSDYFPLLKNGTPNLATAPYNGSGNECNYLWTQYSSGQPTNDSAFEVSNYSGVSTKNTGDVKQVLYTGVPVAYGTSLYTDFSPYRGTPVPYVGNGIIATNKKTGKPAGHCMLIIGYDDNCAGSGKGAFLVQNSFGPDWGSSGSIWIEYGTFVKLAQGQGFYIPLS